MADKKISELDAILGANTASDDFFVIVDTNGAVTKKISRAELNNAIELDVLSTVDINGGSIDGTVIGATTAAAGTFTDLTATGTITGITQATGNELENIVEDVTPQLGADLDVNGNSIVSTSNADINITPNGTGNVTLGTLTFDADQTIGAGQDNYVLTYDNSGGVISLEPSAGGGGLADVVDDTTPQLGGNLDLNSNNITGTGQINTSGNVAISTDNFTVVTGATPQVGIGTASPKRKLEVYGNNTTGAEISLTNTSMSTDRRTMNFYMSSDKAAWRMLNDAQTAGSPEVTLDWNGNLNATSFSGDGSGLTNLPSGGGKMLQVVSAHKTTVQDIVGTAYTQISGLTPSITPSSTASKILVLVSINFGTGTDTFPAFRLYRGGTWIGQPTAQSPSTEATFAQANATGGASPNNQMTVANYQFVDSPSTTAATTYSVYCSPMRTASRTVSVGDSYIRGDENQYTATSHITLIEIGS